MEAAQELAQLTRGKDGNDTRPNEDNTHTSIVKHDDDDNNKIHFPKLKHYIKWLQITSYILFLLAGQSTATLLGRLYFDKGGKSKWLATFVQSAGFLIILPLKLFFSSSPTAHRPSLLWLTAIYFAFGLAYTGDNLMYSYGLLYLPVSTYSLLSASQLAFNAVTSYFINAQKFTALVLNSLVILTISVCLLAINANDDESTIGNNVSKGKYIIGFLCTLSASATFSLLMSLTQFCFEKVIMDKSFNNIVDMLIYTSFVTTCGCVVGLFGSGEWRTLKEEMRDYKMGGVPYVLTLTFTAIGWQVYSVGSLGLIFEVSSLFSNVIDTMSLPLIPILAVVFFHDKMNGLKVVSLVLALWGFASYVYQQYLDRIEANKARKENVNEILGASTEIC